MSRIAIIAALGRNRELGRQGALIWSIRDDLKRFKALTSGHPVIMGRKTWESLPEKFRPLPGRTNIVVSRQAEYAAPGALAAGSLDAAIAAAKGALGAEEIFIIGGAQLYAEALPFADRLYLTLIDDAQEADTFFPAYEREFPRVLAEESHRHGGVAYRWADLARD